MRMAILRVSNLVLHGLLSDRDLHVLREHYAHGGSFEGGISMLQRTLMLPDNARVDAVSFHAYFMYDQAALRIECPDFVDTLEGGMLPEVNAEYDSDGFVRWTGSAVAAQRIEEPEALPRGGPDHCIVCGAKPTHEVVEKFDDPLCFYDAVRWADSITTRYCAEHAPSGAKSLTEPSMAMWRPEEGAFSLNEVRAMQGLPPKQLATFVHSKPDCSGKFDVSPHTNFVTGGLLKVGETSYRCVDCGAAGVIAQGCPAGHDAKRKDGPCRRDYCSCKCDACKKDCGELP